MGETKRPKATTTRKRTSEPQPEAPTAAEKPRTRRTTAAGQQPPAPPTEVATSTAAEQRPSRLVQPIGVPFEQLRRPVTRDLIAERAYYLSLLPEAGNDEENWLRAESELLAELLWEHTGSSAEPA